MATYKVNKRGMGQGGLVGAVRDMNTLLGGTNTDKAITLGSDVAATSASVSSTYTSSLTMNLNKKNIGTVTASDAGCRISTAGDYAIAGLVYNKAASSAVFTLSGTTLTSSQACKWLLTLNAAGTGTATQGNIASTSAGCSLPATPAGGCPVGMITVVAGATQCVPGTTTFSQTIANGGSVVISDILQKGGSAA